MATDAPLTESDLWGDDEESRRIERQLAEWSVDRINQQTRMLDENIRIMKLETTRMQHEQKALEVKIKDTNEKVKMNKQLPYLVSNIVEILDVDNADEAEEDGASADLQVQQVSCVSSVSSAFNSHSPLLDL
jgi:26S proteasome regulatory subunit T5